MSCPICSKETILKYRPFCSKRCADIDLSKWLTGQYAVPAHDPEEAQDPDGTLSRAGDATRH